MSSPTSKIFHILRIACAMCFIGHGAFGIITKQVWCNYFAVFGIGEHLAYQLMPVVGTVDILFGVSMLFYPTMAVAGWLVFWGLFTASLRPLSGEPFAEFIERAGNYGAPFALLLMSGIPGNGWFRKIDPAYDLDPQRAEKIRKALQFFGALLLGAHGWLNLIGKKGLVAQYAALGFSDPAAIAWMAGAAEIAGAIFILVKPLRPVIAVFLVWKVASELFYPKYELLEWIERGGSYGVLLALWLVTKSNVVSPVAPRFERGSDAKAQPANHALFSIPRACLLVLLSGILCVTFTSCTSSFTKDEALRLLKESNAYPRPIDYSIYCGSTEAAKKAQASTLQKDGYITVKLDRSIADVGKPLISFSEKAQPYLLPVSDTAKSIHLQKVKLADEYLGDITGVITNDTGTQVVVEYTTTLENPSPFVVLLEHGFQKKQLRKTYFSRSGTVWQWDKKIVAVAGGS